MEDVSHEQSDQLIN